MERIRLESNAVYLFYGMTEALKDRALLDRCLSVMSQTDKAKIDRYVFQKDKDSSLMTRALLRSVLHACTGLPPERFRFYENAYGKPSLSPECVPMPLKFNLSHSAGMTACAVTLNHDIGVDIEHRLQEIELSIAENYFDEPEWNYIRRHPADRRKTAFLEIWTLKEAYIKARGMGLSIDLDSFSFDLGRKDAIRFIGPNGEAADRWQFFQFLLEKDYQAAISIQAPAQTPISLSIYKSIPFIANHPALFSSEVMLKKS